jgi:hypothetical protein
LLLWGAPINSDGEGEKIREWLVQVCAVLGERRNAFSEPDVIVDLGPAGIVFIEVKYLSGKR